MGIGRGPDGIATASPSDATADAPAGTRAGVVVQAGEVRQARVESLRALAALAVLVSHLWGTAHGFGAASLQTFGARVVTAGGFGVWLFFGLSGYLLFWPFVTSGFGDGGPIDLRRYSLNRALRILPLYYAVVVVVLIAYGNGLVDWVRFGLFGENFSRATVGKVDGPMWSLVVELQFYVLLPLGAWAVMRLASGSVRRAALLVAVPGVLSLTLWLWKITFSLPADPLWRYNLPTTFFFFVVGLELALLRLAWERRPPRALGGPLGSASVWLIAAAALWLTVCWRYNLQPLAAVACFLTIGAFVLPLQRDLLARPLEWRPLAFIGVASYSLYLWHMPLIDALHNHASVPLPAVAPAAVAVAVVSYAVIEAPFLRLRQRWR